MPDEPEITEDEREVLGVLYELEALGLVEVELGQDMRVRVRPTKAGEVALIESSIRRGL